MRHLAFLALVLSATWLGGSNPARGQGEVYDPVPPRGSAYLRIVNGLDVELTANPDFLPQQRLGTAPAQRIMAYTVVPNVANRTLNVTLQDGRRRGSASLRIDEGSFVTLLIHTGPNGTLEAARIVDVADFNRARARIAFYNAMPDCPAAVLALQPSGPVIFDAVPRLESRARSVNPVTADVQARCAERAAPEFTLQSLEAGGMYSVWLMRGQGTALSAFVTRDVTAVWRP